MITAKNWDDRLFSGRNKAYGAYELRQRYVRHTSRALLSTVIGVRIALATPIIMAALTPKEDRLHAKRKQTDMVVLIELPRVEELSVVVPPPPVEPLAPQRPQLQYLTPQVVPDEQTTAQTLPDIDDFEKADSGIQTIKGDEGALPEITGQPDGTGGYPDEIGDDRPPAPDEFVPLTVEPQSINMDEIKRRIRHPQLAKESGIQGKVIVRVLINKQGKYERHIVLKSPRPLLLQAVEQGLPNIEFTPGIQGNKPVPVWVTIPFDFRLE
jgi:protein TonB